MHYSWNTSAILPLQAATCYLTHLVCSRCNEKELQSACILVKRKLLWFTQPIQSTCCKLILMLSSQSTMAKKYPPLILGKPSWISEYDELSTGQWLPSRSQATKQLGEITKHTCSYSSLAIPSNTIVPVLPPQIQVMCLHPGFQLCSYVW